MMKIEVMENRKEIFLHSDKLATSIRRFSLIVKNVLLATIAPTFKLAQTCKLLEDVNRLRFSQSHFNFYSTFFFLLFPFPSPLSTSNVVAAAPALRMCAPSTRKIRFKEDDKNTTRTMLHQNHHRSQAPSYISTVPANFLELHNNFFFTFVCLSRKSSERIFLSNSSLESSSSPSTSLVQFPADC